MREAVAAAPVDCLVVAYGQLAPYAAVVPARHKVLDLHNVESALMGSYAESGGRLAAIAARLERRSLRRIERVALETIPNPENIEYLRTKRERMGHLIEGLD